MVWPSNQCPKLLVSFYGSLSPKLIFSVTINQLDCFGLISMENVSLEDPIWSHFSFLIIHNFASEKISLFMMSNGDEYQQDFLCPPWDHYFIRCWGLCETDPISKNVIKFRRNSLICPFVVPPYNWQKISHLVTVPPIWWSKRRQYISLSISFNCL